MVEISIKDILEEITEKDVTDMYASLPTVKGRKVRTYFVVRNKKDLSNITMNVIRKFSKEYDICYMKKGWAIGVFVVEKEE